MLKRIIAGCLPLLALAACAGAPGTSRPFGENVELKGKLVLRGNDPAVYPVVYAQLRIWELHGVSKERAVALQNHYVTARGRLVTGGQQVGEMPAVDVDYLKDEGDTP